MANYLLAIDQGTTSSRAVIFSEQGVSLAQHQIEIKQYFPQDGWVEHDPEEIWQTTLKCCHAVLEKTKLTGKNILAIGISNQRETTVIWDRKTGQSIYPAIVWQDRRTANYCQALLNKNTEQLIQQKTGLLLDPYFSATKINWILENVSGARQRAIQGELAFGTIDSYLLWKLTNGKQHRTDITNASRTLLFNIHTCKWDEELLQLFNIPTQILPEVLPNNAAFGQTHSSVFDAVIPITGMAGDQQAAVVGQACFEPGFIKSTYGTGCFLLLNTGDKAVTSKNRLLTTIAYQLEQQKPMYCLEGSIFNAGTAVQWLRDALHLIKNAAESAEYAASVKNNGGVYFVPAFTGLGAPYWDPNARGVLSGLTRDTKIEHIVRAALEAVCYQTRDLIAAMTQDFNQPLNTLRVDGGMTYNHWLLQFLANILNLPVERPKCIETSALGAAYLAGLGIGLYRSLAEITLLWKADLTFQPEMAENERNFLYRNWQDAIKACLTAAKAMPNSI